MKQRNRRSLLGALGATVAAGALALGGAVAWADADPATINPNAMGTINIYKYSNPGTEGLEAGTGLATDVNNLPEGAEPIEGVTYTLWKIDGIDLTLNADWLKLQAGEGQLELDPQESAPTVTIDSQSYNLTEVSGDGLVTDQNGFVSKGDLAVGAYILQETGAPTTVLPNSQPYLITVPMTDPTDRESWDYTVNVYPKNAQVLLDKAVNDQKSLYVGDDITYTITSQLPSFVDAGDGKTFTEVIVEDTFPTTIDVGDAEVVVKVDGTELSATGQTPDYTATWSSDDNETLTVALSAEYLSNKGTDLNGKVLEVTVTAKVGAGVKSSTTLVNVENTAELTVSTGTGDGKATATNETNTVVSKYAGAQFEKKFSGTAQPENTDLAKFAVYASEEAATTAGDVPLNTVEATYDNGAQTVLFEGLRASDWSMDSTQEPGVVKVEDETPTCVANPNYQIYWLVETYAPDGFELLAAPVPVVLVKDGTEATYRFQQVAEPIAYQTDELGEAGTGCGFAADPTDVDDITNVQKNAGFQLPLTGGWGTVWLMVAGGVLLGLVLVVARRRRAEEV